MEKKIGRTEEFAKNLLDEATRKAEDKKKEAILSAKEESSASSPIWTKRYATAAARFRGWSAG